MEEPLRAFELDVRRGDGIVVIEVRGELDLMTAGQLRMAIARAVREGERCVVIDLCDLTFIDSIGLVALLYATRRIEGRGGRLCVVCPPGQIRRVIELAGLERQIDLHARRSEALGAVLECAADAAAAG